jgi:hypothetical protein
MMIANNQEVSYLAGLIEVVAVIGEDVATHIGVGVSGFDYWNSLYVRQNEWQ